MFGFGILTGVTFLPLVGVAFLLTQKGDDEASLRNIRWATLAMVISTATVCPTPMSICWAHHQLIQIRTMTVLMMA